VTGLLAFVGVALVVIVTPGPDTALTIRNTLAGGRAAGVRTALGVVCGQASWAVAASLGVAALLVASEPVFVALKLAGAAYLVVLGVQSLVAAVRARELPSHAARVRVRLRARGGELRQGLFSNLANPKMAVFFTSLLPQFADSLLGLLGLGLVFCTLTGLWLAAYATVIARAGDVLRRGAARRAIDAVAGTALIAVGIRLASADR